MYFSAVCGVTGIYSIRVDEYIYIGQASNMYRRWSEHISRLRRNKHGNNFLQNVYNKYGESALSFAIIDETLERDLTPSEQWYLDTLKMFHPNDKIMNLAPVAGSQLGIKRSAETKALMRAAKLGYKHSAESRANMSAAKLGVKHSAESIAKNRASKLGRNAKTYNLILLAPDGERYGPINNIAAFAREHGLHHSHMHKVITGKRKSHKGWRLD